MAGALFRFPGATIEADATQSVAVRTAAGKYYRVALQSILDLIASGGLPSITDDGTTVTLDADAAITGKATITGNLIVASHPPASAAAAGVAGTVAWDAGFVYICVATNTWKRVAIATW